MPGEAKVWATTIPKAAALPSPKLQPNCDPAGTLVDELASKVTASPEVGDTGVTVTCTPLPWVTATVFDASLRQLATAQPGGEMARVTL